MKVFLGGTTSGWKWRNKFQKMLECNYYNPITHGWSEKDRQKEVYERETADYVVYSITKGIRGVYSIAELVDDVNKRPKKTIFLNLYSGDTIAHDLKAVENLCKDNGIAKVFSGKNAMQECAKFINNKLKEEK